MAKTKAARGSAPRTRAATRATAATGPVRARRPHPAAATEDVANPSAPKATAARRRAPKLPPAVAGAVRAALDKKAEDVVVLDLRRASGFTDFFVICTGINSRQI